MILNDTAPRRFWAKVDKSGTCWTWTARCDDDGYGRFRPSPSTGDTGAHRVSFVLSGGVLHPGQLVLHRCDNPPCVRPDHLYAGSAAQNTADMDSRGRRVHGNTSVTAVRGDEWQRSHAATHVIARPGEANHAARLTADDVRAIRQRAAAGEIQEALGLEFGISQVHVSRIVARKNWRHV